MEDEDDQQGVEDDDQGSGEPGEPGYPPGVGELAHFALVIGELHQRNQGEGQLKTENHLAKDEQSPWLCFRRRCR